MLGKFFKPKWQHSDPKVRIQGLTALTSDGVELINIAQADPNSDVRMEAITLLTHLPTLVKLGHTPGSIGERARQRVIGLAASNAHHDHLLADVFAWLQNPALLRSIARDRMRGSKLRQQAIEKLDDQELLFEIANTDASKEIQYLAAKRLHDLDKLTLLEKNHGKNNKRLRQLVKERTEQAQQQQQLEQAIDALCAEAESLGKSGAWVQDKTRQRVLGQRWQSLAQQTTNAQQQRFQAAMDDFSARLHAFEQEELAMRPVRETRQHLLASAAALLQQLQQYPESLNLSELDARIQTLATTWAQQTSLPASEQAKLDAQWQERYADISRLRATLADDLRALEHLQDLHAQASTLRQPEASYSSKDLLALQQEWNNAQRPRTLRSSLPELEQHFQRNIAALKQHLDKQKHQQEAKLAELRQNLQQLEALLENEQYGEAIEVHKALSVELKAAPVASKELAPLQRRIQMLTPFLRELQDWKRWGTDQARKQLIETADHLRSEDDLDPQERAKKIRELRAEWRKLAQLEPNKQQALWKTFDTTLSAAYEPSKQYFNEQAQQREANLAQRQALCAQLEALHNDTDWTSVRDWRSLQAQVNKVRQQWKDAGTVSHKAWRDINARFNAAMEALEAHFQAERQRNWQAREALVQQAKALLELSDTAQAIEQAKALQNAWQISLGARPSEEQRLWKQFREPIDALFARAREERQQQQQARQAQQAEVARLAAEQKQRELERQQQQWAALDALAAASETLKQAETPADAQMANRTQGEQLCLQLEILLGIDTPAEFQQARLKQQVAQLSEAMLSRKDAFDPKAHALPLLKQWYALGGMPASSLASQSARIAAIRRVLQG